MALDARDPRGSTEAPPQNLRPRRFVPFAIGAAALLVLIAGTLMVRHAETKTNKIALADQPKPVTVVEPRMIAYRASRTYIGTIEPWVEAKVGPQLVSAYVATVLVRPGAVVKKGDVIATLDCRNTSATSKAVAMQAGAFEARQKAFADEASRLRALVDGGFVSPNEVEQKEAQSASEQANLLAQQAKLLGSSLEVNDCVLRAPFNGEVATRGIDPGAFVRPGSAIVSVVDRSIVRVTADAPEVDFDVVAPSTKVTVHVIATGKDVEATVARRAPAADSATRTVHFELDVPDPERLIPVGTTAELRIDVGDPSPALRVPLAAAAVRGVKASLFTVEDGIAHARVVRVLGEIAGQLFLEPVLPAHARVVTEGRAILSDGDRVSAKLEDAPPGTPNQVGVHATSASATPEPKP